MSDIKIKYEYVERKHPKLYTGIHQLCWHHNNISADRLVEYIFDIESVRAENAELRGINQSMSVNYVKYKDMKGALEFFARLEQDMLIVDINRIANAALRNTVEEPI